MRMKKGLAILLILGGIVALSACGSRSNSSDGQGDSTVAEQTSDTQSDDADVQAGLAALEALEQQDAASVEQEITELKNQIAKERVIEEREQRMNAQDLQDEEIQELDFRDIFSDCMILGDSIASGIDGYGFLDSASVISKTGISMSKAESHLDQAKEMNPKVAFMSYGSNDIANCRDDYDAFREICETFLTEAMEKLPDTEIYVNSIFPSTTPLTQEQPWYQNTDKYNQILREVCEAHDIPFLDNTSIIKDEWYARDGFHFSADMYPFWLYRMAKGAGL